MRLPRVCIGVNPLEVGIAMRSSQSCTPAECIPHQEVNFHPHSFADPDGRLFLLDGQLYRGIAAQSSSFFKQLFESGVLRGLIDRGLLIETELTTITVEGYNMVLRHRYIPFPSYPNEWCPAMLKDAAATMVALVVELEQHELTLRDAHPWNLLFDSYKPLYVDVTSITPAVDSSTWPAYYEFCRFCLYPLILMSAGHERIARLLICEDGGVLGSDLTALAPQSAQLAPDRSLMNHLVPVVQKRLPHRYYSLFGRAWRLASSLPPIQSHRRRSRLEFLKTIGREIESMTFAGPSGDCVDQDANSSPAQSDSDRWTTKQHAIHNVLAELRPGTVLDIGSGTGWYSRLAAHMNCRVVSFDIDPLHVTQLYVDARDKKLPILPLIMDFTKPTPARGLANHWSIAATERFRCDMVLALGLLHQIVFERHLNFDQIVDGLAQFAQRWLVVEFISREDREVSGRLPGRFGWYTLENFTNALQKRFRRVNIVPSSPAPRVLLLCEK